MNNTVGGRTRPELRTAPLVTSAVLIGAGTLIALVGMAVGGAHLGLATRQWVRDMEVPPSEVARVKWAQARSAVAAGQAAWQNGAVTAPRLAAATS